jgi:hypothetical protein
VVGRVGKRSRVGCVLEMWSASGRAAKLWASGGEGLLTARAFRDRTSRSSCALCCEEKVCGSCGKSRRPVCTTYPGAPSWRGDVRCVWEEMSLFLRMDVRPGEDAVRWMED